MEPSLLNAVEQNSAQTFDVIIEGQKQGNSTGLFKRFVGERSAGDSAVQVRQQFLSIDGLHASLTGRQILFLARLPFVSAIVANEPAAASGSSGLLGMNRQLWPWVTGAVVDWFDPANLSSPTSAIVDSGIDTTRSGDFGSRVLTQVNLASLTPNSPGDGYGHGTFVAGIAAGAGQGDAGVSPRSNLVSLDVMNDQGEATVADIVNACDWILKNKATYNIKVANFSLHAVNRASVMFDPLDQAVEKLWLNGVVVVAAAGNYASNGSESGVPYAPGNDPFVITVGAADTNNTFSTADDFAAPWSAWGYTGDGFMKPDISAPGRYIIGPVTPTAALSTLRPGDVVSPGYMQLSGTSFSAPMVAGAAAELIAQHPNWTPDQVKGALMVSANPTSAATPGSLGVGELNIAHARRVDTPPNPNAALDQYLTTDPNGNTTFNAAAWQTAALANPAWDTAAWSDAAWSSAAWASAAWASAAWASAAWSSAAWSSAAWASAAWGTAAWASAAWGDAAWADNSSTEPAANPASTDASTNAVATAAADLGINPNCDPTTTTNCLLPTTPQTTP